MENLNLSVEEDNELVFGEEDTEITADGLELCLVGRFITDQSLKFNILRSCLASVWKLRRGVEIKDIGNGRLLARFYHKVDLKRVIDGGPWSIGNHPLIIHPLKVGEVPHRVPLDRLAFWIQIYNLPVRSFSENVGRSLGNFIGRFLEYDTTNRGAIWKPFMRIRAGGFGC